MASDVVVSPPPDPVNAGIAAVDVVATVELVVGAGVVAGRAAVVVVATAAEVDVVACGVVVVVDSDDVVTSVEVVEDVEVDVGMICASAGCQAKTSAPATASIRTSARIGVVWRGCTSSGLRCAR